MGGNSAQVAESHLRIERHDVDAERAKLEEEKAKLAEAPAPEPVSFTEALAEKFADETPKNSQNDNMEILTLHDEGLTEVEIAKKLGRGLGEVKFVLGLYQEGK